MTAPDAIRRAQAWLAAQHFERCECACHEGDGNGYGIEICAPCRERHNEPARAAERLAALGPASVGLAVALDERSKAIHGILHNDDVDWLRCDMVTCVGDRGALAEWAQAAGERGTMAL